MRTFTICWIVAAVVSPSLAKAGGDVEFQLHGDATISNKIDGSLLEQPAMKLVDREWNAPGIEQAAQPLPPLAQDDQQPNLRFHLVGDGPYWLDNVAWPRTRELFHAAAEYQYFSMNIAIEKSSPDLY